MICHVIIAFCTGSKVLHAALVAVLAGLSCIRTHIATSSIITGARAELHPCSTQTRVTASIRMRLLLEPAQLWFRDAAARQPPYCRRQASGDAALLEPGAVLGAPAGSLRACGLSERKAAYILDLANRFASGALSTARIATMDDDAMFAELSAIKGIGAPTLTRVLWDAWRLQMLAVL